MKKGENENKMKYTKIVKDYIYNYHKIYPQILNKFVVQPGYKLKSSYYMNHMEIFNEFCISKSSRIYKVNSLKEYIIFLNHLLSDYYTFYNSNEDSLQKKYRKKYIFRGLNNIYLMKSKRYLQYCLKNYLKKDGKVNLIYENEFNDEQFKKISKEIFPNEVDSIKKFEENACLRLKGFNTVNELIANAKHYELNTRFVDWSYSPLVTTLFAISEAAQISLFQVNEKKDINSESIKNNYYCLMIREYNDNTLIIKDLPYNFSNVFNEIEFSELTENAKRILNDFKQKVSIPSTILQPNYFYCKYKQAMNLYNNLYYLVLTLSKEKRDFFKKKAYRQKMKENFKDVLKANKFSNDDIAIVQVVVNYFDTLYDLTNSNDSFKRESVILMTRKFIASGSKVLLETSICNDRLRNQRGIFEIDTYNPYESEFENDNNIFLLINASAKNEIVKYINALGINYYMLMDEPYSCSEVINKTINGDYNFNNKIDYPYVEKIRLKSKRR